MDMHMLLWMCGGQRTICGRLFLLFHHESSGDWTQVASLGGKHLYPQSQPTCLPILLLGYFLFNLFHIIFLLFIYFLFYIPIRVFPLSSLPSLPPTPTPSTPPHCFFSDTGWASHGCQPAMLYQAAMKLGTSTSIKPGWGNPIGGMGPKAGNTETAPALLIWYVLIIFFSLPQLHVFTLLIKNKK